MLSAALLFGSMRQSFLCPQKNSIGKRNFKVSVVGATGGIGQSLSLLLKQNPLIDKLNLHDVSPMSIGLGVDLSHISAKPEISSFTGDQQLTESIMDSDVVVISAGLPRKPGMTRNDLLSANAVVAARITCAISEACPKALVAFITNPVNSIVPIAAEFLKATDSYDPRRLFGITTLDVVRARTFIGDFMNVNPTRVELPVIGGHAGITILPIFTQCMPEFRGNHEDAAKLTQKIQEAGTEVVKAKQGKGSATLSMAFAASQFVNSLLRGLNGEANIIECSFVGFNAPLLPFFATPLVLGRDGIEKNLGLPDTMNDYENDDLSKLLPTLRKDINVGIEWAKKVINSTNANENEKKQSESN